MSNKRKNINALNEQELENLGWEKMFGILEQEMPQPEQRRRFVLPWYWGGIAASILMIVAMGINGKLSNHLAINNQNIALAKQNPITHSSNDATINSSSLASQSTSVTPSDVSNYKKETKLYNNKENVDVKTNTLSNQYSTTLADVIDQPYLGDYKEISYHHQQMNESVKNSIVTTVDLLPSLQTKALSFVNNDNKIANDLIKQEKKDINNTVKKHFLNWSADIAAQSSTFSNVDYSVGIYAKKSLGTRWGISSGVQYNRFTYNTAYQDTHGNYDFQPNGKVQKNTVVINSIMVAEDGSYTYQDNLGNNYVSPQSQTTSINLPENTFIDPLPTNTPINYVNSAGDILYIRDANNNFYRPLGNYSLHYLSVPLTLEGNLTPKLSLSVGIKGAFLLTSRIRQYELASFSSMDISQPKSKYIYRNDIFQHFDGGFLLGTAYDITPKWNINIQYYQGLLEYSNTAALKNKTLRLGIGYRFR